MVYDCGSCIAKYVLCAFNFVIFVIGTLVLGVGVWILVDRGSFIGLANITLLEKINISSIDVIQQISYILVAVGGFIFIISFLGYCGALKESRWMLTLYGILLILIVALEIAAGVLAITYKAKAEEETRKILKENIQLYQTPSNDGITTAFDTLQVSLKCCGIDNYKDFDSIPNWSSKPYVIPPSCCKYTSDNYTIDNLVDASCPKNPTEDNSYYERGCYKQLITWILDNLNIVIITACILVIIEILGILFAFCLTKNINLYEK